ncbi:MAG: DUF63 family protein [Candidatus Heimdallarchaeota archaeon]|nr:DUF63 family protein [Candidatus Heimdallarchaeota archaeon]
MTTLQNPLQDFLETLFQDLTLLFSDPILFLDTYFFSAPGYNLYNTIIYCTVGILAIFLIGKIIIALNSNGSSKWGDKFIPIKMDDEFFVAVLPYIFIGATLRALQDIAKDGSIIPPYEFFADRVFVTPGVYIVTILLTIIVGIVSIFISQEYLQKNHYFSNWRYMFVFSGIVIETFLLIPFIPLLLTAEINIFGGFFIILGSVVFGIIFHYSADIYSARFTPEAPIRRQEKLAMITQMFDAINTVVAIAFFNYQEKHYLPSMLFQTPAGSWPFLFIKFGIVALFLWALRGLENRNVERWLLWVIFLLGLATGTRDFLRLVTNT